MGYHKQQISLDVMYIDTTLPHTEQRCQLKPAPTFFFTRTHLERHPHRDSAVRHLAILQQEHKDTDEVYVDEFDPVIIRLR